MADEFYKRKEYINEVLKEREKTHGPFKASSRISQVLKTEARCGQGWWQLSPTQQEAIEMILHKVSRIVTSGGKHKDSWVDISGYATLVANELE